jgi:hypothetical protein
MTAEDFYNETVNAINFNKIESEQDIHSPAFLVDFAEAYHKAKLKNLPIHDVSKLYLVQAVMADRVIEDKVFKTKEEAVAEIGALNDSLKRACFKCNYL